VILSRPIPFLRLVAEGVTIVASILLAFGIDAWWDQRKDSAEEHEVLIGLEADFFDLRTRLSQWDTYNRTGVRLLDQFLSDSVARLDRAAADSAFFYVVLVNVLDQGGPLEALMASGRLELIQNREIRLRLAKWPDWLEDIHTNDLSRRETAHHVSQFLTTRGWPDFDLAGCGRLLCAQSGEMPTSYLRLSEDPEFRALLYGRKAYLISAANDHGSRLMAADETLALIRREIESRWPAADAF
jgi:hypothetical protein